MKFRVQCTAILLSFFLIESINACNRRRSGPAPDTKKPTNTACPADIDVKADARERGTRVTWDPKSQVLFKDTGGSGLRTHNHRMLGPGSGSPGDYYTAEGSPHRISYNAYDNAGNVCTKCCEFRVTVRVINCEAALAPANGYISCNHGRIYGSECSINCMPGHNRNGESSIACQFDGTWTEAPTCTPVECNPELSDITSGTVTCTLQNFYQSACIYQCVDGYSIARGQLNSRICGSNGAWSGALPTCDDTSGPDLQCPRPVVVYADENTTSTRVSWDVPEATDNSGATVDVVQTDGPARGTHLEAGYYTVRYVATDAADNDAQCQFSLLVRVIRCPGIYGSHTQLVDCPTGFNFGSICRIQCAPGYIIQGEPVLRCERIGDPPRGKWNLGRPRCEAVHCPALQPPENGQFRNGVSSCPTLYASWCYFECDEGYERIGSYSRHCLSHAGELEGFWDGEVTTCEPASCPSPYIPAQATIINTSVCPAIGNVPAGTTCHYQCEEGHILIGRENITCDNNGRWDGSFPRCQIIQCDNAAVPVPEDGFKNRCPFQRIPYGSSCLLGCNLGYMPVKGAEVTCLANPDGTGRWDGTTVTVCDPVSCVPFDPPEHGSIQGCNYEGAGTNVTHPQVYQTVCAAACDDGFTPFGTINRNCLVNAIWDGIPLRCDDVTAPTIQCPDPVTVFAQPRNDFVVSSFPWEPLEVSDASPPVEVRLLSINSVGEGENRTTLFSEGAHTFLYAAVDQGGNEDTCTVELTVRVTRCPPLGTPQHGESELIAGVGLCESYSVLGSVCRITCEEGYHLADESEEDLIQCLSLTSTSTLGYWESQPEACDPNTCNVPVITGGYVSGCLIAKADYQSTCQFICIVGYTSSTGRTQIRRTCRADGSWTGQDLECQAVQCPGGFQLQNGLISPQTCTTMNRLQYGTTCQFACDDGFRQTGPYSKRCGADGTWSNPRNVACIDEQAPRFTDNCPRYIQVYAESGSTEATIDYEVPEATDNAGEDEVLIERQSGLESGAGFTEGSHIVRYTATDEAGNLARCDIHVSVLVHRCSPLQAPASGSVDCPSQILGSQCHFQCNVGYEINGADDTTCVLQNSQPTWDNRSPQCTPVQCPALPNRPPAIQSGCQSPTYGAVCLWACPYGYQGSGDSASTCQANATWSGEDFACDERQCSSLEFPDFIRENPQDCASEPSFEDSCHLGCQQPGFRIDPPTLDFIRCRGDGQWSQDTTDLECIDYEAPRFTACPLDFPVYAARGETQANVEWEVAAQDNSGEDIEIICDREVMTFPIGDYFTSCSGRDTEGNVATCQFWFRVRTRNCQQLNPPVFGTFVGPCPTIHGSRCTITCVSGYKLEGPDKVTCERNEETQAMYWQRDSHPVCRISSCPTISRDIIPLGGGIYPTFCTGNTNPNYGVSCRFYCRNGYSLVGYQDPISCQRDGTWDVDLDTVQFECEDRVNPIIEVCPGNQYANLNEGQADVEVYFDTPTARDNSGQQLRVVKTPSGINSPHRFAETTVVRYEFFDAANNSASCSFQVFIQNNLFPEIDHCPSGFSVEATGRLTTVSWDPPQFSEPSGDNDALLISCNFESGTTFPWGTHNIICSATNSNNGKTVECRFSVEVIPRSCPPLRPPKNGALACDEWAYGQFCNQQCNDQFDVPPGRYEPFFICGSSGRWSTMSVLDCSFRKRANRFNLASEIQYFTGDCNDPEVQLAIQQAFIELISEQTIGADVCDQQQECRAENVNVVCGEATGKRGDLGKRRKRSAPYERVAAQRSFTLRTYADHLLLRDVEDYLADNVKKVAAFELYREHDARRNARRNARADSPSGRRNKRTLGYFVTVSFDIVADSPLNTTTQEDYEDGAYNTIDTLYDVVDLLEERVVHGTLVPEVPNLELDIDEDSLDYDYPTPTCELGEVVSFETLTCVPCSPGSHFDEYEGTCVLCGIGEYQDSEGATVCKECPLGHTTLDEGSLEDTQCLPVCLPGQYSYNGVEPCALCEIGFYQPEANQDGCLKCPQTRRSTEERGSTSVFQCIFECAPGNHSETGLEPCKKCPIRYYQPNFGERTCELCPGITTTLAPGAPYEIYCNVTATCEENNCVNGATCLPLIEGPECQCPEGFEGEYCEVNIDDCTDLSCENDGTCVDGANSFTCVCREGFDGDDCSTDLDECESDPCDHAERCVDLPGDFVCECEDGYEGKICDEEILPCESEPCVNNGTCDSILADFTCTCPVGFTGDYCEVNINDCQIDRCLNGGTCVDLIDAYICLCTPGYSGDACEIDLDLCDPNPCVHGMCLKDKDNFTCICPSDKAGRFCERNATICDKGICVHGVCSIPAGDVRGDGLGFSCDCTGTGFSGPRCESFVDHCSTGPCSNGGTCRNNLDDYTCICPQNFTGANCEHYINPCDESPCENNATCTPDAASFRCICPIGFEGEQCESPWEVCMEGFCQNGGVCGDPDGIDFCICPEGYKGVACQKDVDECKSQPCENGGSCTDGVNSYSCSCVPGYRGEDCEDNIDECLPEPCVNGLCIDRIHNYTCECYDGYEGPDCEVNIDDCIGNNCVNGECVDGNSTYRCVCDVGYRGRLCEEEIDECASNPCVNAVSCTDGLNSFECVCEDGWTGVRCELSINDCTPESCENGGTCTDQHEGFSCLCPPGYRGDQCQEDINECASDPCINSTCIDAVNGYVCICPRGREGKNCQVRTSICMPNPCTNGGTCSLEGDGDSYSCFCQDGFLGDLCEENVDDCEGHGCQNGGRCIDEVNSYSCACVPGYGGDLCDEVIDLCQEFPCENGGTCSVTEGRVECACTTGYEGALCQKNIDDCFPNPCIHEGVCVDGLDEFTCVCAPGYSGELCEDEIDECVFNECHELGSHECLDGVANYTCICRHGWSGELCDIVAESNFDMIFTANQTAQYILLRDFSNQTVESFTLALWVRTLSPDALIFSHVTDEYNLIDAHLILAIPTALTVIVNGFPIYTGVTIDDDIWHHVALTFDHISQLFSVYVDGGKVVGQVMPFSGDVIHPSEVFVLGRLNETTQEATLSPLFGSLSRLNIWDQAFSEAIIRNLSLACYVPIPGNVIGMVDFLDGQVGDVIFLDPSFCDAGNECFNWPCVNDGYCIDSYFDFDCICQVGLQGETCEMNPDDCVSQLCENSGTCIDGLGTFTCACAEGYTGALCELELVHGGWSEWTEWTTCSASCEGGDHNRTRECNNPVPANGGSPCGSVTSEWRKCNPQPCPACRDFKPPKNGYAECTTADSGGDQTCTAFCFPGYDFAKSPRYEYICGPSTDFKWSHESASNPRLRVPGCTKIGLPTRFQIEIFSRFPFLRCNALTAEGVKDAISVVISANTLKLGCIASGLCSLADVTATGCESAARRRRSAEGVVVKTTIYEDVNITMDNVTSSDEILQTPEAEAAVDDLLEISQEINSSTTEGAFRISTGGVIYEPVVQYDYGYVNCTDGQIMKYNQTVCLACPAGMFQRETNCLPCEIGYYQPDVGKTSCKTCPDGRNNTGIGAVEEDECQPSTHFVISLE